MTSSATKARSVLTESLSSALIDVLIDAKRGPYSPLLLDRALANGLNIGGYHTAKQALDRLVARVEVDESGQLAEKSSRKRIPSREEWESIVVNCHKDGHKSPSDTLKEVRKIETCFPAC